MKWMMVMWTLLVLSGGLLADVVRVYSARHYASDAELYRRFEALSGLRVELVEAGGDALLERIRSEGRGRGADLLITVDAGRLWAAQEAGVLAPVRSEQLLATVPEAYRHADGYWYGLTKRARILVYARERVAMAELGRYEDLVAEKWRGRILVRSSGNVYNQSLLASMIAHHGEVAAAAWADGVLKNLARRPQSNDTGQIRALAAGLGDVALVNHYYFTRLLRSEDPRERALVDGLAIHYPNQQDRGTHINISGAGVLRNAANPAAALRLLEFLASPEGQQLLVGETGEFGIREPMTAIGVADGDTRPIVEDRLGAQQIGVHTPAALRIFDRVGWR